MLQVFTNKLIKNTEYLETSSTGLGTRINLPGIDFGDSFVGRFTFEGKRYAYSTGCNVKVASSTDGINWKLETENAVPYKPAHIHYLTALWAPEVITDNNLCDEINEASYNGNFIMWICTYNGKNSFITALTSDNPLGPFICEKNTYELTDESFSMLDPSPIRNFNLSRGELDVGSAEKPIERYILKDNLKEVDKRFPPKIIAEPGGKTGKRRLVEAPHDFENDIWEILMISGSDTHNLGEYCISALYRPKGSDTKFRTEAEIRGIDEFTPNLRSLDPLLMEMTDRQILEFLDGVVLNESNSIAIPGHSCYAFNEIHHHGVDLEYFNLFGKKPCDLREFCSTSIYFTSDGFLRAGINGKAELVERALFDRIEF